MNLRDSQQITSLSNEEAISYWNELGDSYVRLADRAMQAIKLFRLEEAIELENSLISILRTSLEVLHLIGRTDERFRQANEEFVRTELALCYSNLGCCYQDLNRSDLRRQICAYLSALQWNATDRAGRTNLWSALDIVNKFYSMAVIMVKGTPQVQAWAECQNMGYTHLKTPFPPGTPGRNWQAALNAYRRAVEIMPERAESWHGLGLVYSGLEREAEAISAWQKAFEINPNYNFEMIFTVKIQD